MCSSCCFLLFPFQMQVLQVMSLVIERTGSHIAPHCQILIHYLPQLWQQSEEHNMLQSAIITTLTGLVNVGVSFLSIAICYI